jgi:hypothetical protein
MVLLRPLKVHHFAQLAVFGVSRGLAARLNVGLSNTKAKSLQNCSDDATIEPWRQKTEEEVPRHGLNPVLGHKQREKP